MTRFARAHGSKASNERLPEPATSWDVMKQQLKNKLQSSETNADSTTSSQKIWKSSDFDRDVWNKNEVEWADLDVGEWAGKAMKSGKDYDELGKKHKKKKHSKTAAGEHIIQTAVDNQKKRKKKKIDGTEFHDAQSTGIKLAVSDDNFPHGGNTRKIKKIKKMKKGANDEVSETSDIKLDKQTVVATNNTEHDVSLSKKHKTKQQHGMTEDTICEENNKKKKLGKKRKSFHDSISDLEDKQFAKKCRSKLKGNQEVNHNDNVPSEARDHQLKKKHKHSKNESTFEDGGSLISVTQNFPEEDAESIPVTYTDVSSEKHKRKKKFKDNKGNKSVKGTDISLNGGSEIDTNVTSDFLQKEGREKKRKQVWQQEDNKKFTKKLKFSTEHRKIKKGKFEKKYLQTTVLHMNGKDIEIVKFDGFPVKKEDAEHLLQLKKKMIANGIPASEIKATMKLERRKAEKALAREKKKVCFHCRNSGHVLSECPELGKAETDDLIGTGICFKCGSTEHKHFECRVTREQEFRYAKCFICNEQGHIARQCPDNPRGLYPKGGGCHICGDVTHLKKDCPDLIKEKEEKIIKLQTLSNNPLEALEDDKTTKSISPNHVNKKRTVKF